MNLGNIPILGQAENKDKRIKELEQELRATQSVMKKNLSQAASIICEQRDKNMSLITALRWFLKSRPEMRVRINIKEFNELIENHKLVLHSYFDKQTDDIVFYIDNIGVKENGGIQETDTSPKAAINENPKENG